MKKPMFTTAQVAEHFQVKPKTVLMWIATKKIKGIKIGKSYRFEAADIESLKQKLRMIKDGNSE